MNIKHLPLHLRPREKLIQKGVDNVKDKELFAILLRTGRAGKNAIELAEYILSKFSVSQLSEITLEQLLAVEGIDQSKACTILAAFELSKRARKDKENEIHMIFAPSDALRYLSDIRNRKKEYFVALYVNARSQLIHQETISVGTLNASLVHPREVFEPAIRVSAGAILIAHNHPSGDTSPSDQDIRITRQLIEAGRILDIEILDHLIVASNGFTSMKETGLM